VKSPEKEKPAKDNAHDDSGLYQEEAADNLYFEPVILLPDKVEVVTDEEDETAVRIKGALEVCGWSYCINQICLRRKSYL
jgi:hypothetical protein